MGKYFFKIQDPRTFGSKNIGATNILRSGNKSAALFTLTFDMLKGLIIILTAQFLEIERTYFVIIAVILGHIFPLYLLFKGGKGVATFFGVLIGLHLISGVLTLLSWLTIFLCFKQSSLSALISIIFSNFFLFFLLHENYGSKVAVLLVTTIIIFKHRENIKRILNGEEFNFESPDKN